MALQLRAGHFVAGRSIEVSTGTHVLYPQAGRTLPQDRLDGLIRSETEKTIVTLYQATSFSDCESGMMSGRFPLTETGITKQCRSLEHP